MLVAVEKLPGLGEGVELPRSNPRSETNRRYRVWSPNQGLDVQFADLVDSTAHMAP